MGILLYQIGIFIIIILSSLYSRKSRNTAIFLISVFTVLQVYTSGLMIIQFITIFIAYLFSKTFNSKKSDSENKRNEKELIKTVIYENKINDQKTKKDKEREEFNKYQYVANEEIYLEIIENFQNKKYYATKKLVDVYNLKQINEGKDTNQNIIFDIFVKTQILNYLAEYNKEFKVELSEFLNDYIYNASNYTQLVLGLKKILNEETEEINDPLIFGDLKWFEIIILMKNLSLICEESFFSEKDLQNIEEKLKNKNFDKKTYNQMRISEIKNILT